MFAIESPKKYRFKEIIIAILVFLVIIVIIGVPLGLLPVYLNSNKYNFKTIKKKIRINFQNKI